MMKRKILLILSCLMIFSFVFSVYADWVLTETSGDWAICEYNHWKGEAGDYQGIAVWENNESLLNFIGYYASIHIDKIDAWVTSWFPWDSSAGKGVNVCFELQGNNTNIKASFVFEKIVDLWGALGKSRVYGTVLVNSTEYYGTLGMPSILGSDNYVEVWITKTGDAVNVKIYHYASLLENPALLVDKTINVGSQWFSNVSIKLRVEHYQWGGWTSRNDGCFEARIIVENLSFSPTTFPTPKPLPENIWDNFVRGIIGMVNAIPSWIRDVLNQIYEGMKWVASIFYTFFGFVVEMLPLLFPIIIFWILDAGITSIYEGSFTPIGMVFSTIYDFIRGIIQTIANILQTIWDILTFWS